MNISAVSYTHLDVYKRQILDTARLRYLMSEYLNISSSNIHAYIMGEHGDSSFVPWTHAYVGCKKLLAILDETHRDLNDLQNIYVQVQQAGYEIVNRKKSTYYGIGLSLNRLCQAILKDEHVILTIAAYQNDEYGQKGLYIGVPALIVSLIHICFTFHTVNTNNFQDIFNHRITI